MGLNEKKNKTDKLKWLASMIDQFDVDPRSGEL